MKKLLLTTTCVIMMTASALAVEPEADIKGLYISPKFLFSHMKLDNIRESATGIGSTE